jgi:hypothetical protein
MIVSTRFNRNTFVTTVTSNKGYVAYIGLHDRAPKGATLRRIKKCAKAHFVK